MKRLLSIMLMVAAVLSVSAQAEKLHKSVYKGDPMLDTQDAILWSSDHTMIKENADGTCIVILECKDHIFTDDEKFRVGFYDDGGNLLTMCDAWYYRTSSDGNAVVLVNSGFSNDSIPGSEAISDGRYMVPRKAILDYLKQGKGYVRFVTTTYGDYIYDVQLAAIKE